MSSQITEAFVQQYSNNVQMLSQQKGSLLRGVVDVETVVGKHAYFERIGAVSAQKRVSRHSDTPQIDTPHSRRRVSMSDYEWADLIDQQDRVRTLIDPTSSYALAAAYAMGRSMDDSIIEAVSGNAFGGETGSTTIALPSAQKITESGTAGLTIAKLRSAKEIMDSQSIDPSIPRTIVVSPKQITDLLGTTEVTSVVPNKSVICLGPTTIVLGSDGSTDAASRVSLAVLNFAIVNPAVPLSVIF